MSEWETNVADLKLEDKDSSLREQSAGKLNATNGEAATNGGAWVERSGFNYGVYNAKNREERDQALKQVYTNDVPIWAALAAKYEWKEEYGDVAPRIPELEDELYKNEFINRQGKEMARYGKILLFLTSTDRIVSSLT